MTQTAVNGNPSGAMASAIIHRYTRQQAIADGEIIDITQQAKGKRFVVPVAVSRAVWAGVIAFGVDPEKEPEDGPTFSERIDAILEEAHHAIKQDPTSESVAFTIGTGDEPAQLWAAASREDVGADKPEIVVTIMMQGED